MNLYLLTSVANAGCGPAGATEAVSAETMDDALRQWIAQHGWIQLGHRIRAGARLEVQILAHKANLNSALVQPLHGGQRVALSRL
jgi:hypothetical protein